MTVVDQPAAQLSIGSMGFPAISRSEIPSEVGVFALITAAPPGGRYCGVDLAAGQLFFYAPGTSFVGVESAGLEACLLTVPTASLELAAEGFVETAMLRSVTALSPSPDVERLGSLLRSAIKRPTDLAGEHAVEAAAGVLATGSTPRRSRVVRRLGSHAIVVRSIEYATGRRRTSRRWASCAGPRVHQRAVFARRSSMCSTCLRRSTSSTACSAGSETSLRSQVRRRSLSPASCRRSVSRSSAASPAGTRTRSVNSPARPCVGRLRTSDGARLQGPHRCRSNVRLPIMNDDYSPVHFAPPLRSIRRNQVNARRSRRAPLRTSTRSPPPDSA